MVVEDYLLRKSGGWSAKREALAPVWIGGAMMGARRGRESLNETIYERPAEGVTALWQPASAAKSYATDARLRLGGRYVRGRPHERDAWRHVALAYTKLRKAYKPGETNRWWEMIERARGASAKTSE